MPIFLTENFILLITEQNEYTYAFQMGDVELGDIKIPTSLDAKVEGAKNITLHGDSRSDDTCIITFKTNKNMLFRQLMLPLMWRNI